MTKRYYWLKLKEDFFEDDTIQWLEEQENGKEYTLFYLKLCLRSLRTDGRLIRYVGEYLIPYDTKALSKITNTDPDTIKVAMDLFQKIGLIQLLDSGEIFLKQLDEMVGSETNKAELMRRKRAEERELIEDGNNVTPELPNSYPNVTQSIENRDKEIDIEKDKELEADKENREKENKPPASTKKKYGEFKNVLLTTEEYKKLVDKYPDDYLNRIERLSLYIESSGKKYKNHYATILTWAKKDEETKEKKVLKGASLADKLQELR